MTNGATDLAQSAVQGLSGFPQLLPRRRLVKRAWHLRLTGAQYPWP